jgi:regulator of protease activity HflC (stomatin/prohibitin superfamily)
LKDVISKDNVSIRANAVVYFRVMDAEKAVIQVEHYEMATSQLAQTSLRSVVGQHDFDEMLVEREKVNAEVQRIVYAANLRMGDQGQQRRAQKIDLKETMIPRHRQAG